MQAVYQLEDKSLAGLPARQTAVQRGGGSGGAGLLLMPGPLQHQAQMAHNLVPTTPHQIKQKLTLPISTNDTDTFIVK